MGSNLSGSMTTALLSTLMFAIDIYKWILIARIFMSWINPDPYNPVVQFIHRITEPVLAPFRRLIPAIAGLDLSPIAVFLLIQFLQTFLYNLLRF